MRPIYSLLPLPSQTIKPSAAAQVKENDIEGRLKEIRDVFGTLATKSGESASGGKAKGVPGTQGEAKPGSRNTHL